MKRPGTPAPNPPAPGYGAPSPAFSRGERAFVSSAPGFTLIELLVVIGIIAILAAMLFPVLVRAKQRAQSVACMNNLRQLQLCWHMYALDYGDHVPPNNFVYDIFSLQPLVNGDSWCTNVAPFDTNVAGITGGKLFRYNQNLSIYRCPADQSTVETPGGVSLGIPRLRSYSMSQSINGDVGPNSLYYGLPCFDKLTDIRNPDPSRCFAFIEVHEDEIIDTEFGIPTQADPFDVGSWWDVPANRHNQGCNFSFADGHVEHWHWQVPMAPAYPRGYIQPVAPGGMADYQRVSACFAQVFQ